MIDLVTDEFINYLAVVKNYSKRTLPTYESSLKRYFKEMKIKRPVDVTPESVEKYFAKRIKAGKSVNSNFNIMVALRAFLIFCNRRGYAKAQLEMFEVPKRKRVKTEYVTPEEVNQMVASIKNERDRLILLTLFTSGCRVSELIQLSVESFSGTRFSVIAKGSKPHVYYIDPVIAQRLALYIQIEGITEGQVFRSTTGKPLMAPAIAHIVRKYAKLANISHNVFPHQFRHGFATASLENGVDPRTLQEMMGHDDIHTTMRYMHVTDQRMKESHARFAPKLATPYKPQSVDNSRVFRP